MEIDKLIVEFTSEYDGCTYIVRVDDFEQIQVMNKDGALHTTIFEGGIEALSEIYLAAKRSVELTRKGLSPEDWKQSDTAAQADTHVAFPD